MREFWATNKEFVVVILCAELVVLALIPIAFAYDNHVSRVESVLADRLSAAVLEHQQALDHGRALAFDIGPGQSVEVGGSAFTPSSGNTVRVQLAPDGYCVRTSSDSGNHAGWLCWRDGSDPLSSPGHPLAGSTSVG